MSLERGQLSNNRPDVGPNFLVLLDELLVSVTRVIDLEKLNNLHGFLYDGEHNTESVLLLHSVLEEEAVLLVVQASFDHIVPDVVELALILVFVEDVECSINGRLGFLEADLVPMALH